MTVQYDPITGIFTRNGKIAGTLCKSGYRQIKVDGVLWLEHRLAWFLMAGDKTDKDIDHRNEIKHDNRFTNLRPATDTENQRNRGKPKNNTSGYKGVSWNAPRQKWQATIRVDGRNRNLGAFVTRDEAARAYDFAALQYHGEFAKTNFSTDVSTEGSMTMRNYDGEQFIHMPIPASMIGAVCALLGGTALASGSVVAQNAPKTTATAPSTAPTPEPAPNDAPVADVAAAGDTAGGAADDDAIDAAGWPWSAELHASTKGQTKEGLWRMKVGVSRPDPKPGFPKADAGTGTTTNSAASPVAGTAAPQTAPVEDEDEFAAFRSAAASIAPAGAVPAREWTDADLGALCNQAAIKLGDPTPIKKLISEYAPAGGVIHSRMIPVDKRAEFADKIEKVAGIEFAG